MKTIVLTLPFFLCVQLMFLDNVHPMSTPAPPPIRPPYDRLLMKGLDNDDLLPWIQMTGIYQLQNETVDQFPVYKHESIEMYLYYNRTVKELRFGQPYQNNTVLLGARTDGTVRVIYSDTLPYAPFAFITKWYQYDPSLSRQVELSALGRTAVEPTCVAKDIFTCSNGMVEFDGNLSQIDANTGRVIVDFNIVGVYFYSQLPGLYVQRRPVYSLMTSDNERTLFYLYYNDGLWLVGTNYNNSRETILFAEDKATRPEHITNEWKFYTNGKWTSVETKLRCRAFTASNGCDSDSGNSCLNGGECSSNDKGLSFCNCPPGFRGRRCEVRIASCPPPKDFITRMTIYTRENFYYYLASLYEGSVMTIFRDFGLIPKYWFVTCEGDVSPSWSNSSIISTFQTTVATKRTTTASTKRTTTVTIRSTTAGTEDSTKKYVFENSDYTTTVAVAVVTILMQIFNPLIIALIIICVITVRQMETEKAENAELDTLLKIYQNNLDAFKERHPEPENELDDGSSFELKTIHNDYQIKNKEIMDRIEARNKQDLEWVQLDRIYSLYAYVTFWIWLLYFILYIATNLFGGTVFLDLFIIAVVFIILIYIFLLFEYRISSEKDYINKLSTTVFAVDRIEALRSVRPSVVMTGVCYHYETRTRTVTYTDSNGYTQSRIETYQEQVITDTVYECFTFNRWKDTSDVEVKGLRPKGITRIKMTLSIEPGDLQTADELLRQYTEFRLANLHRDTYVDYSMEKTVAGFEERLAACTDSTEKSWWISANLYLAATILMMGWPYRFAFNAVTGRTEYTVSKLIYTSMAEDSDDRNDVIDDGIGPVGYVADVEHSGNGYSDQMSNPPPYSVVVNMQEQSATMMTVSSTPIAPLPPSAPPTQYNA